MAIVICISGGCVAEVLCDGPSPSPVDVLVADYDVDRDVDAFIGADVDGSRCQVYSMAVEQAPEAVARLAEIAAGESVADEDEDDEDEDED